MSGNRTLELGKRLFDRYGCSGCHTYKPAAATATVGPDLDKLPQYARQAHQPLARFVHTSIVNPSAYIQPGFPNVMPVIFKSLPRAHVRALVTFLTQH